MERTPKPWPGGVLAWVEPTDEGLTDVARGTVTAAGRLAERLGWSWAVGCPKALTDVVEELGRRGVSMVVLPQTEVVPSQYPDVAGSCLATMAARLGAGIVVLAHDDVGVERAPLVAARMGGGLVTEAIALEPDAEGGLTVRRRVFGSRLATGWRWGGQTPLVVTLAPTTLSPEVVPSVKAVRPTKIWIPVESKRGDAVKRIVETIPPDPQTVDLTEAEVILCAGKGFDRDSFEQFRELARLVGGSVGVTRPVYDLGWAGFERMVGQTGRTVRPRFYLGVGISGSMHHVGGIKDAKRLVSLNVDPKAPIFPNSDEGFVADLRQVLPLLVDRVRARVGEAVP